MAAAQGFALYLSPPSPAAQEKPAVREVARAVVPVARPAAASPKFKVRSTVCTGPSQRSMALIWAPGASDTGRWIKEGEPIGHFVIHEVRAGSVVYRDGEKLCEMAIEREPASPTAVAHEGRSATSGVQAAVGAAGPAQATGRPKRPTGGSRFTVGSTRSSTSE
jgi:hypothetical protein